MKMPIPASSKKSVLIENSFAFFGKQIIIYSDGKIPNYSDDLTHTKLFKEVLSKYIDFLSEKDSPLLKIFGTENKKEEMLSLLQNLSRYQKESVLEKNPNLGKFFSNEYMLLQFVEEFYNYWRNYERFFVCYSDDMLVAPHHERPYTTFNDTVEKLNNLVRKLYRDLCENISGTHPLVYRQLHAGAQVGLIVAKNSEFFEKPYSKLKNVNHIKQVLIEPPLIIDPPLNKRTGEFKKIDKNPLDFVEELNEAEWLCYPAIIGELLVHIYFNNEFIGLGTALSNLFELANGKENQKKPDAVYLFGIKEEDANKIDSNSTVFFNDKENNIFVATVPSGDKYAYFGYLKKMALTLHNAIMIERGRLPVHGAMVEIRTKNGSANIIIVGDTGAGKSESLEAFRMIAEEDIKEMKIIFDDMGSLAIENGEIKAYGTEIGAFVRLDDLQPGYAFGNIDRSIIMSPQKINARAVLPITNIKEVLKGHKVDYFLYANNYEEITLEKPIIEIFIDKEKALEVFRTGKSMSKGTTTSTGITQTYFVNIFGATQYKEVHDKLAEKFFEKMLENKTIIGQIRTQLGIKGYEMTGPEKTAKALLEMIKKSGKQ